MKVTLTRAGQVWSKLFFCLRVTGDPCTFLQLLRQSKVLDRYQKSGVSREYGANAETLSYSIRFLSARRTIYLRTYAGDIRMLYEIFWEQVYRLPSAVLGESPVIVDAGANIGMAALYFSIVYPRAQIFCIEPDADNFKLLRQNMDAERDRVVLIGAALYDRDGRVGFAKERWAYNSRIDEGDGVDVEAIRLDTLLDRYRLGRIDLLKIDIEGAEDRIFAAETDWLARVAAILIEVHNPENVGLIGKKLVENGFHWQLWGRAGLGASLYLASRRENTRLACT